MKKNNSSRQGAERRKKGDFFNTAEVFEIRKVFASSECINPYEIEAISNIEYLNPKKYQINKTIIMQKPKINGAF